MKSVEETPQIGFIGISLCVPNLDVFNTILPCDNIKLSTFPQPLLDFKDKVKLKKNSFAFINGPIYPDYLDYDSSDDSSDIEEKLKINELLDQFYSEDYEQRFLYHFKKIFPKVPFISTFRDNIFGSISNDLTNGKNLSLLLTIQQIRDVL